MRLVFLDFHGVLHPSPCEADELFCRAPLLADAIRDAPDDVRVVIASTWRFHHPLAQLKSRLPQALAARIFDHTGPARPGPRSRYREILAYLERSAPEQTEWRALDDSPFLYPPGCPQLIVCNSAIGIDEPQIRSLVEWWSG